MCGRHLSKIVSFLREGGSFDAVSLGMHPKGCPPETVGAALSANIFLGWLLTFYVTHPAV